MTKSTITRERLEKIKSWRETYGAGSNVMLPAEEAEELARMALAEKASEPVILYRERNPYNGLTTGWQELTENEFSFLKENAGENAEFLTLYRHAQPAPVVPEEVTDEDCPALVKYDVTEVDEAWARGFNACRSAMLQELKKSAGTEATCRSNENVQVLTSINPAPDLVSLPKNAKSLTGNSPVIPDGYVMVPKEPTESMVIAGFESEPDEFFSESEVWEAYQKMSGCEQAAFRARLCWTAMLAAAPQEVKGE